MNNEKPRVSIGMAVFNGEKYIEETLDSILAQTYRDFELIISDNASTDRTQEICQTYAAKDRRIRYSRNSKNLGAAPNYNRTVELARGQYFKWADHDDLLGPDFIAKCIEVLDQHPEAVLCFPRVSVINEYGTVLGDHKYKSDTSSLQPQVRFRNLVLNPDTGYEVSGLMRVSAMRQTGLIASFPASDLVFLAELALHGQFIELTETLFFPRYHPHQSTKGELTVERDRVVFFDTSNAGKILLPKWLYLFGYLWAINNAPLSGAQRLYCYFQMVRWCLKPDHFRALGKDVLLALNKLLVRTFIKPKAKTQQTV